MIVKSLKIKNFRNISNGVLETKPHLNFFVGSNAQGKTSVLEAISYLSNLKSFKSANLEDLIKKGETSSKISCIISHENFEDDWKTTLETNFYFNDIKKKVEKTTAINGKFFKSSTKYLSQRYGEVELGFHAVTFHPFEHEMITGSPSLRRNYLDNVLMSESIEYLEALKKYNKLILQRNVLLKTYLKYPQKFSLEVLKGFTEPLGKYSALIIYKRLEWLKNCFPLLNAIITKIAPHQLEIKPIYFSNWLDKKEGLSLNKEKTIEIKSEKPEPILPTIKEIENNFFSSLEKLHAIELSAGCTLIGPHRDDFNFFLGETLLKSFGSQGEIRTLLIALKIAEIELFKKNTGHKPVFLIDDFSSELDLKRRNFLLKYLETTDLQVFISTTEKDFDVGNIYYVKNGSIGNNSNFNINNNTTTETCLVLG